MGDGCGAGYKLTSHGSVWEHTTKVGSGRFLNLRTAFRTAHWLLIQRGLEGGFEKISIRPWELCHCKRHVV